MAEELPLSAPRRILVIRLDRLGDVVLSTPVLRVLRQQFPHAFIAMMVRPSCRDVIEGHPLLNESIIYEKETRHRGLLATFLFARKLKRYEFDTALILHPSARSHWIAFLAGIPNRVGFNRKSAWLLTRRLPHQKQEGKKHEAAYTLEMLQVFGITPPPAPEPSIVVQESAQRRVAVLLEQAGISRERLVAIHPSASCVSKRWMPDRFAQVADRLVASCNVRICLVAGAEDAPYANAVASAMQAPVLNLAGRLTVAELAALLQRSALLLSNDSGPVHMAAALGTPVVDIFGRNQRGLSPLRWGPIGKNHIVLHKEVGCVTCLAHACDIGFLCLTALPVDEVFDAVKNVLDRPTHVSSATL